MFTVEPQELAGPTNPFPAICLQVTKHDGDSSDNLPSHTVLKLNGARFSGRKVMGIPHVANCCWLKPSQENFKWDLEPIEQFLKQGLCMTTILTNAKSGPGWRTARHFNAIGQIQGLKKSAQLGYTVGEMTCSKGGSDSLIPKSALPLSLKLCKVKEGPYQNFWKLNIFWPCLKPRFCTEASISQRQPHLASSSSPNLGLCNL